MSPSIESFLHTPEDSDRNESKEHKYLKVRNQLSSYVLLNISGIEEDIQRTMESSPEKQNWYAAFYNKLNIAKSSLAFFKKFGYLDEKKYDKIDKKIEDLKEKIKKFLENEETIVEPEEMNKHSYIGELLSIFMDIVMESRRF